MDSQIEAIAFDYGGVIAGGDHQTLLSWIQNSLDLSEDQLDHCMELRRAKRARGDSLENFWADFTSSLGKPFPSEWIDHFERQKEITLQEIPGMLELVKSLQGKSIVTAMLSNVRADQADVIRRKGHYASFSPLLLSYEIGFEKPDQEAYIQLLKELDLPPEKCLFIDDLLENVEAARSLGIDAIHFQGLTQLLEELKERGIECDF